MSSSHLSRPLLRAVGLIVSFFSAAFIARVLCSQWDLISSWRPPAGAFFIIGTGILVYAANGVLLSSAYWHLLLWAGEPRAAWGDVSRIYGRSQIAKYIPGNVAQFLGRHVIGRQCGWSHTGLLLAGIFELFSLLSVAAIIAVSGMALQEVIRNGMGLPAMMALGGGTFMGMVLLLRFGPVLIKHRWPGVAARLNQCRLRGLWPAFLFHVGFFFVSGIIFLLIGMVVFETPLQLSLWPGVVGLMALAWAAGVIAPGAPSGLGVRESVLIFGLGSLVPTGEALLASALFRVVTVGGDILFFLVAARMKGPFQGFPPASEKRTDGIV